MSARSRCASQMTNDQFAMTNRSTKAVSHQAQVAAPILHPASPIINRTSSIIDLSTSYLRRRSPCDTSQRPLLLPLHRTIPDNSRGHFVRSVFQLFPRIKGPAACRSGQFKHQLSPRIELRQQRRASASVVLGHDLRAGRKKTPPDKTQQSSSAGAICPLCPTQPPDNSRNECRQRSAIRHSFRLPHCKNLASSRETWRVR